MLLSSSDEMVSKGEDKYGNTKCKEVALDRACVAYDNQQNPHIALTWAPEGKRTRGWGQLKVTWRRTVEKERQKMVLPPGVKLSLLQETERVGGEKSMTLFSQRRLRK